MAEDKGGQQTGQIEDRIALIELFIADKKPAQFAWVYKVILPLTLGLVTAAMAFLGYLVTRTEVKIKQGVLQVTEKNAERTALIADAAQKRADTKQDMELAAMFAENYFTENEERRRFALVLISGIGSDALQKTLYDVVRTDPAQTDAVRAQAQDAVEFNAVEWTSHHPKTAWCFQVKQSDVQFLVSCHWSKERCEYARTGPGNRTPCSLVEGLDQVEPKLQPGGFRDSWWHYSQTEFQAPYPPFSDRSIG